MKDPTIAEILEKMQMVLDGMETADAVAEWAVEFLRDDRVCKSDDKLYHLLLEVSLLNQRPPLSDQDVQHWKRKYFSKTKDPSCHE